ncbi:MAG: DUF302 domain-containing protein [Thermoanaerobaculia bacterium]|nr:DUF302 domain-containing protein [Thermoanaerobaculia bacterium]
MSQAKKGPYGYARTVDMPYEQAIERVTATLKEQGFGILTEIDVKATLKKKIDKDFTKYVILGACNPGFAFQALSNEIDIGLLLPCNVTVYENPADGRTVVSVLDPETMVTLTGRSDIAPLARQVREKVVAALDAV